MTNNDKSVYRSFRFWMSLSAAVLLVLQTILQRFGIEIDVPYIQEVISAVLAVLVIIGVIWKPKNKEEINYADNKDSTDDNITE